MKQDARQLAETSALLVGANAAVYSLHEINLILQMILASVSICWVTVQTIKFCVRWWHEHKEKLPPPKQEK